MEIKNLNIEEFKDKGYLQEINRRFFHPLGMMLYLRKDGDELSLGGIADYRDDPEGCYFGFDDRDEQTNRESLEKKEFIDNEFSKRIKTRQALLGFGIEDINEKS